MGVWFTQVVCCILLRVSEEKQSRTDYDPCVWESSFISEAKTESVFLTWAIQKKFVPVSFLEMKLMRKELISWQRNHVRTVELSTTKASLLNESPSKQWEEVYWARLSLCARAQTCIPHDHLSGGIRGRSLEQRQCEKGCVSSLLTPLFSHFLFATSLKFTFIFPIFPISLIQPSLSFQGSETSV